MTFTPQEIEELEKVGWVWREEYDVFTSDSLSDDTDLTLWRDSYDNSLAVEFWDRSERKSATERFSSIKELQEYFGEESK